MMIRIAASLCALAVFATPLTAQTFTPAEQAAMAQIETDHPLVHALMLEMGRYDNIVGLHGFWIETVGETHFAGYDRALWETQIAETLTSDRLMRDFAAAVSVLPLTVELIADGTAFYASDFAQRQQGYENDIGRVRIRDEAQYDTALAAFREIEGTDDPRAAVIARSEVVNQSVEFLLDRTFAEDFAFYSGLRAADYYLEEQTDDDLRDQIAFDREAIRPEIEDYYNAYRVMMLDNITVAEFNRYLDFLASETGRVIGDFMRDGSDAMVWTYHFEVGRVMAPIWIAEWEAEQATSAPVEAEQ